MIVMNSHKFILQKVYKIQNQKLTEMEMMELKGFVKFLTMKMNNKQINNNDSDNNYDDKKNNKNKHKFTFNNHLSNIAFLKHLK